MLDLKHIEEIVAEVENLRAENERVWADYLKLHEAIRKHRDFHEYELEAEENRDEIKKLREEIKNLREQCEDQQITIDSHEREILAMRDTWDADREKIIRLREKNQVLTMAIQDHYDVWRTGNDRLRLAQNKWLWRTIDITEDDTGSAHG